MSRPWRHPKTGVYYFRKAVPADLRCSLGKREVKHSLHTKEPATAKAKHAAVAASVALEWKALRTKPEPLSQRQIVALAGIARREHLADWQDEPGSSEDWVTALEVYSEMNERGQLERAFGNIVDALLLTKGVSTDAPSRERLIAEVGKAYASAAVRLMRHADGDYGPDPQAIQFPDWVPSKPEGQAFIPARTKSDSASLTGLMEDWWQEAVKLGRKPSTRESAQSAVKKLVAFLNHDDARRVTAADVIAFKDHRLAEINPRTGRLISPKTIKCSDLSALKVIFKWAVENLRLPANPAHGVTVRLGKTQRLRSKGFTDTEARAILSAAWKYSQQGREGAKTVAAKHWVPWLLAYSGARVGEMAQLRKEDLRRDGSHWILTVTPKAGTVKTNEARDFPLHLHLVELGFPAFVAASAKGHLFLTAAKNGDVLGPLGGVKNRLREFVRDVVADPNVAPNHGWRHRFKTIAREVGVDPSYARAIQGHKAAAEDEKYGDNLAHALAREMMKFPRYEID